MLTNVADILRRTARRTPERPAIHFLDRTWTYQNLDKASSKVANHLIELGLEKGDRVAVFGKNSDSYILLWFGILKAGLVQVPINYALTGRELKYMVEQSEARALFSDVSVRHAVDAAELTVEISGTLHGGTSNDVLTWAMDPTEQTDPFVEVGDRDLAQILYTSGTTAEPKGAMLTHVALVHHYASCGLALDITAHDRILQALPLYHSAQMHVFMMPGLMLGAQTWLLETPAPELVLNTIAAHALESFFAPPTVWIGLLALIEKDTSRAESLKKAYYGAAIMPVPVLERLRQLLPKIGFYNCFGQSEIGPLVAVLRPEDHDERPASAGRAAPFVDLRVVDDDLNDVAPGEVGEAVYRSPQLCEGYWNKPEETAEAFEGGWFHSGDLARIDSDRFITIVDRKKDMVKTGGVQVSSREVEEAIFRHPSVHEVAVIPIPDPKWVEAVAAVVVLHPDHTPSEDEIIAHARTVIAPFKVPKRVFFVEELPRNTAGKILKRVLRDMFA